MLLFIEVFLVTFLLVFALEVALIKNQVKKIDDIYHHCIILVLNHSVESVNQWFDNHMCNLERDLRIIVHLLQN